MVKIVTEIQAIIDERNEMLNQIADLIVKGIAMRRKEGKLTEDSVKFICDIIKDLNSDDKVTVLTKVVTKLSMKQPKKDKKEKELKSRYFD